MLRCELNTIAEGIWIVAENARGLGAMHEELLAERRAVGEAPAGPWYVMFCNGYATWFCMFLCRPSAIDVSQPPGEWRQAAGWHRRRCLASVH